MTSPKVVVGITTKNRAFILPRAIDSALSQDYSNTEVVILDDGSTDDTSSLRDKYPNISWRRHCVSTGIIESRNELMRDADATYYVSLDDDAWFIEGDELSLAVALLENRPSIGAIAFDILSPERRDHSERSSATRVGTFIGCGHILRLSAAREAGLYAKTPGTYGSEERDLCMRMLDQGHEIMLVPGVHVWHDKAWDGRDSNPLHKSGVCNEFMMIVRRCPFPDLLVVFPLKILSFCLFWFRHPRFFLAGLAGIGLFLRHAPFAFRTRAPVRRSAFYQSDAYRS